MGYRSALGASVAAALLASAVAFAQAPPSQDGKITPSDQSFLKNAAIGGQFEVEAGKLAERSANPKIKEFGAKMVQDHGKADAQLKQLVASHGWSLPQGLDSEHAQIRDHLASLKGEEFDREYMQLMVKDHDQDTKEFADEERTTHDPQLKQFVQNTLTVIKEHDQMARQIAGSMSLKTNAGANRS